MAEPTTVSESTIRTLPAKRKRWKRRLLVLSLSFLLFVFFAPAIVANTGLRNWIAGQATGQVRGTVQVGGASFWWFSAPYLENVEIRDEAGNLVVQIPHVQLNKSLLSLLLNHSDLGEIRLQKPGVFVEATDDTTNLEGVFSRYLGDQNDEHAVGAKQPRTALRLLSQDAKVVIAESGKTGKWTIDPLSLDLRVDADRSKPIEIVVQSTVTDNDNSGKLDLNASLSGGVSQKLKFHVENLPLSLVELAARRLEPGIRLAGRATAQLDVVWGGDAGDSIQIEGKVGTKDLVLTAPNWIADQVALSHLDIPVKVTIDKTWIRVDQIEMTSDFGRASIRGEMNRSALPLAMLQQSNAKVTLDVDLARLAALFPKTMHLQEDLQVTTGQLQVDLNSAQEKDGIAWRGAIKTTNLKAMRNGQPLTWDQPLDIDFLAKQAGNGFPTVERLHFASDFGMADMATTADTLNVTAECDLTRLRGKLSQFVDLGSIRLDGIATAKLTGKSRKDALYQMEGEVTVRQLNLTGPTGKVWQEPTGILKWNGVGKIDANGAWNLVGGGASLQAGADWIWCSIQEPIADLRDLQSFSAKIQSSGNLARIAAKISPWTTALDGRPLGGDGSLVGLLKCTPEGVQVDDLKAEFANFSYRGDGMNIQEASVKLDGSASLQWESDKLQLSNASLISPTATIRFPLLSVEFPDSGMEIKGRGTIQADLARLERWFLDPSATASAAGVINGTIDLEPANGTTKAKLDATVQNALVGTPTAPYWRERELGIAATALYTPNTDSVRIDQLTLRGDGIACSGKGTLSKVSVEPVVAFAGDLEYDWARLEPQLRAQLGNRFSIAGKDSRPLRINGPLSASKKPSVVVGTLTSPAANSDKPSGLVVELGMGWDSLSAFGAKIGAAKVDARLEPGWLKTTPIVSTLSDGQLRVEPSIRFDQGVAELLIAKGSGVQRARITPAMCSDMIGYAAPALAGVGQAEGEFSFVVNRCQAPLSQVSKSTLSAQMDIHSMTFSGSPLLNELTLILQGTSIATRPAAPLSVSIAKESKVNIEVVNGRVYHDKMELVFPELTIRTSGSVGFDGTLSLIAEMTIPPRWIPGGRLKPAIAKQVIQIPIRGTLSHPKMDEAALRRHMAKVLEDVGKDAAQDLLKKELEKGLDKLFPKFQKK